MQNLLFHGAKTEIYGPLRLDCSKRIMMKPEQLRQLYFPYHSLDPMQAIERMLEVIGPEGNAEMDDIARGVMALRKVRNRFSIDYFARLAWCGTAYLWGWHHLGAWRHSPNDV